MKKAEAISILATSVRPREAKDRARYDKAVKMAIEALKQPERTQERMETHACDLIDRQAAIEIVDRYNKSHMILQGKPMLGAASIVIELEALPSAQPERTCVNCGRTVNNGGWYAGGRTRCPIEEHYALPKDGFCHLWEKRNVTNDDCPERREE